MKSTRKPITAVIGSAFVSSALIMGAAQARNANPFAMNELSTGYTLAQGDKPAEKDVRKGKEGNCGEGKCGANKSKMKPGEGKCGANKDKMKGHEGKCGGMK